jgi:putative transposase
MLGARCHTQRVLRKVEQATDAVVCRLVRQSFLGSDRTYVARRVWHDVLALEYNFGWHRIECLIEKQALRELPRRDGLPQD